MLKGARPSFDAAAAAAASVFVAVDTFTWDVVGRFSCADVATEATASLAVSRLFTFRIGREGSIGVAGEEEEREVTSGLRVLAADTSGALVLLATAAVAAVDGRCGVTLPLLIICGYFFNSASICVCLLSSTSKMSEPRLLRLAAARATGNTSFIIALRVSAGGAEGATGTANKLLSQLLLSAVDSAACCCGCECSSA